MRAAKSETPALLAERLAKPFQVDNVRLLRSIIGNEKFGEFQNFFKSNLLKDPDGVTKALSRFDDETLREVLTPNELSIFRTLGQQIDQLNSIGIRKALQEQDKPAALINQLIFQGKTADISRLFDVMTRTGGRTGPLGRSLRAGVVENVWEAVAKIPRGQGQEQVFRDALNTKLRELRAKGITRFLRASDVRAIRDIRLVRQFTDIDADTGTSMVAGTTIGGLTDLATAGFATLVKQFGVGRFLTSGVGRRILTGVGREQKAFTMLKAMTGAFATALSDAKAEAQPASGSSSKPGNR